MGVFLGSLNQWIYKKKPESFWRWKFDFLTFGIWFGLRELVFSRPNRFGDISTGAGLMGDFHSSTMGS